MEACSDATGSARQPSETPIEYLRRILLGLTSRVDAVRRLTGLFEQAKFSRHEIDVTMKQDAIGALREIRDDLAGSTRMRRHLLDLGVLFVAVDDRVRVCCARAARRAQRRRSTSTCWSSARCSCSASSRRSAPPLPRRRRSPTSTPRSSSAPAPDRPRPQLEQDRTRGDSRVGERLRPPPAPPAAAARDRAMPPRAPRAADLEPRDARPLVGAAAPRPPGADGPLRASASRRASCATSSPTLRGCDGGDGALRGRCRVANRGHRRGREGRRSASAMRSSC